MPDDAISRDLRTFITNNTPGGYIQSTTTISDSEIDQRIQEKINNTGFLTETQANDKYLQITNAENNYLKLSDIATVATSGSYNDLSNTPALADVAITGDYTNLLNRPSLSDVAISGRYDELLNKPKLPIFYNIINSKISFLQDLKINNISNKLMMGNEEEEDNENIMNHIFISDFLDIIISSFFNLSNNYQIQEQLLFLITDIGICQIQKIEMNSTKDIFILSLSICNKTNYLSLDITDKTDEEILNAINFTTIIPIIIYDQINDYLIIKIKNA